MLRVCVAMSLVGWMLALTGCGAGDGGEGGSAGVTDAGAATYQRYCFSCHQAGVAGAPRIGDVEAWAPRIAKGPDALLISTIQGVPPGMPAATGAPGPRPWAGAQTAAAPSLWSRQSP